MLEGANNWSRSSMSSLMTPRCSKVEGNHNPRYIEPHFQPQIFLETKNGDHHIWVERNHILDQFFSTPDVILFFNPEISFDKVDKTPKNIKMPKRS